MDNNSINIDMKEVYEAVIRNGNNTASLSQAFAKAADTVNENFDEVKKAFGNVAKSHKALCFATALLGVDIILLALGNAKQEKKIKALELRVESLERRRNLHVCSGDCHTEE